MKGAIVGMVRSALMVIAAGLAALVLLSGCGGGDSAENLGNDRNTAPAEALTAIRSALQEIYSWRPAQDNSRADAYERARPYLTEELAAQKPETPPRGNGAQWERWKEQRAIIKAEAAVVDSDHPKDEPELIVRTVIVTQQVLSGDNKELDKQAPLTIQRVAATKTPNGWRVKEIKY